ncbi:MAG: aminotransferase class I/II-fold pyridoxal phosphate-dependent enzyme [Oscillospiraceae bacterium]|nr:aminotransferase class I/II-fold pyridoxal phosphate-dependent enzyme [Oscillospiraceae bacterium]
MMNEMSRFDLRVDRSGMSTVKQLFTPERVRDSEVISLWGAEFEFPTAKFVSDAVVAWAEKGLYAYTVEDDGFRDLVCSWMKRQRCWEIQPSWIVPVYGITASLATAMRAFTKEGDGIIGLDPSYHMYWHAVELSGRSKVPCRMLFDGERYSIDWNDLERKIAAPENRILVLCNPHNPTGKVFSRDDLRRIAALARAHDVIIFNDEIFAECIYDGVEMPCYDRETAAGACIITATSLGKWLSFTGTNQANLIIPDAETREAFLAERDREFYGSMNPMMLPAYRAAYTDAGASWARELMTYVEDNYKMTDHFFREKLPQFHAVRPEGTFILWVDARAFCEDADMLQKFLNQKALFHVDPGVQYNGDPGFFRMTLSVPRAELRRALESLEMAVREMAFSS